MKGVQMNPITVNYRASQKLQKQLAFEGRDAREAQTVVLESPALIEFATVDRDGVAIINLFTQGRYEASAAIKRDVPKVITRTILFFDGNISKEIAEIKIEKDFYIFDEVPTAESLLAALTEPTPDLSAELADKQAELDAHFENKKTAYLQEKAVRDERENERKQREDEKRVADEAVTAERVEWIEKNGSARLKKMLENGYELKQTYERERAEKEIPDFSFDRDDIKYSRRANPSLQALQALEACEFEDKKIIWVTDENPDDDSEYYDGDEFEPYEALLIHPEWSRTPLLKQI